MGVVLTIMRIVSLPILGCVSLVVGLWVGFITFGNFKSPVESDFAIYESTSR